MIALLTSRINVINNRCNIVPFNINNHSDISALNVMTRVNNVIRAPHTAGSTRSAGQATYIPLILSRLHTRLTGGCGFCDLLIRIITPQGSCGIISPKDVLLSCLGLIDVVIVR